MKTTFLLAALISAALLAPGQAQEPTASGSAADSLPASLPSQDLFPTIPAPADAQQPQPAPKAPAPDTAPASALETPDAMKKGTSAQLKQAILIRQLKTALLSDPVIQNELNRARCAKTEEGHRILMRNYYTLLYTKIERLNPSVFETAERELHDALARYEQNQVRPSKLIEPGICPLPRSNSKDHIPGACTAPATPTPTPAPSPAPTPFVEAPPISPS